MIDVQVGYSVYTHLTHHHDNSRKNSFLAIIVAKRHNTLTVKIKKLNNKIFYVSPQAVVAVRKNETLNNSIEALAKKFSK